MTSTHSIVLIALCYSLIYFNDGVKADCGGIIEEANGTITSPEYPYEYPPNQDCLWEIKGPPNKNIWFHFKDIEIEHDDTCSYDSVNVKGKIQWHRQIHWLICGSNGTYYNISEDNNLYIQFKSDGSNEYRGFEMEFQTVPSDCGGFLERREETITSPEYPQPYRFFLNCTWNIQAPHNHIIKLTFSYLETEVDDCVEEYVTVQNVMADREIQQHGKFCGRKAPPTIFTESNNLQIQFYSQNYKGKEVFRAKFTSAECGGLIDGGNGNISSPFFPDLYPSNTMCEWNFLVPPHHKIKLNFLQFEVEGGIGCTSDFLLIQSNSTGGKVFEYGKYCGHFGPSLISSKENIIMTFVSDRSNEKKGFMMEYNIDKLTKFESSVSSGKSTTPVYESTTTPAENQYDDIENVFTTSRKEENTFTDKYDSKVSSEMTTATSTYGPNQQNNEDQQKETENVIMSITNILSALTSLTKKVADLEERQIMLFNHYENMFNNFGKSIYNLQRLLDSQQ